ncbi:MAG: diacylglycerol kinase family protein [Bacteroidia bacterium]|nr:diacylglycerol kinase family protein [Bacteroidia bacterium]
MHPTKNNSARLVRSFRYAIKGLKIYLGSGGNVKIHLAASFLVLVMGCWFRISLTQWCVLVLASGMVHAAEAMNTSIENIVDFISPQQHPQAEKIKDLSAGAVLISAMAAALAGLLIFIPLIF